MNCRWPSDEQLWNLPRRTEVKLKAIHYKQKLNKEGLSSIQLELSNGLKSPHFGTQNSWKEKVKTIEIDTDWSIRTIAINTFGFVLRGITLEDEEGETIFNEIWD